MNDNEIEKEKPKLLRVPVRCVDRDSLLGTIRQLENVENLVILVNDDDGTWILVEPGTTIERINWMLDRAKIMLHE